jgi:hypothetical protein
MKSGERSITAQTGSSGVPFEVGEDPRRRKAEQGIK